MLEQNSKIHCAKGNTGGTQKTSQENLNVNSSKS